MQWMGLSSQSHELFIVHEWLSKNSKKSMFTIINHATISKNSKQVAPLLKEMHMHISKTTCMCSYYVQESFITKTMGPQRVCICFLNVSMDAIHVQTRCWKVQMSLNITRSTSYIVHTAHAFYSHHQGQNTYNWCSQLTKCLYKAMVCVNRRLSNKNGYM